MQRLLTLFVGEISLIWLLHRAESLFPITWSDLGTWVQFTPADQIVIASFRYAALGCAYWLLATTVLYVIGLAGNLPSLIRSVEWATLPLVRSAATKAIAVAVAATSFSPAAAVMVPPILNHPVEAVADRTETDSHTDDSDVEAPNIIVSTPFVGTYLPPGAIVSTSDAPEPTVSTPRPEPATTPEAIRTPLPDRIEIHSQPRTAPSLNLSSASEYEVVRGDNLWDIAAKHLAERRPGELLSDAVIAPYWATVIEANKHRIASGNPDWISPGEVIELPPVNG